jgi:leucine-rich repeat-containing G protein-coupled receptor 8
MVSEMFSHDLGAIDFTRTQTRVGFYGNDGVCLFKYFIRKADPQRVYVWSVLVVNFVCFLLILVGYIVIGIISTKSSRQTFSRGDEQARKRNMRMNRRISIIIMTDFFCWVPFIVTCMLHYLELFDATPWYSVFSMIILPINSVINPILYNDFIITNVQMFLTHATKILTTCQAWFQ